MAAIAGAKMRFAELLGRKNCTVLLRKNQFYNNNNGLNKVGILGSTPVANLTATHGEPYPRVKPWPYKTRSYNMFYELFDSTIKRLNDNSKIIVVDGNLAIDKSEFAQKVAKEFDLLYVPEPKFDDVFIRHTGFDIRELDEQLSYNTRAWDLKRFYTDPKPERTFFGLMQIYHFINRMFRYTESVHHMLSTGQGLVMVRSPFSDSVFTNTMRKFNYYSPEGHKFYNLIRDNTICELLHPHLFIYLDAPVSMVRDGITKRNIPHEQNSKVLTDAYLQSISDQYLKTFLPQMSKFSEVLIYDLQEGLDMEIVVEDMERLDLDTVPEEAPERFLQWSKLRPDEWNYFRKFYGNVEEIGSLFNKPQPWEAPELMLQGEDYTEYHQIVSNDHRVKYAKGYDPVTDSVLFKF